MHRTCFEANKINFQPNLVRINQFVCYVYFTGIGCKVAGFLTVFATHLSVFTLTLITIERWYAITHAIYLNKRIKIKAASCIMVFGWIYSMVMSSLPLFGFSNYSSTRYVRNKTTTATTTKNAYISESKKKKTV